MSDSQRATEIVHEALTALRDNGAQLRASAQSLEHLAASAGAATPPPRQQPAAPVSQSAPPREMPAPFTPPPAAPPAVKAASSGKAARLEAIRAPILACTKCPNLVKSRTQVVFGVGNPDAELMFVGEAPGADEDMVGEPFVGKAGQLLTKIIETMGFRRADVFIANVLKCRPDMPPGESGNRKPTLPEMDTCKPYLIQQIEIIQPRVLVALGASACEGLLGLDKFPITRERGTWREYAGIPLMPTFHPAYLLHTQSLAEKRKLWEDMLAALEKLGRPITERQRAFFLPK